MSVEHFLLESQGGRGAGEHDGNAGSAQNEPPGAELRYGERVNFSTGNFASLYLGRQWLFHKKCSNYEIIPWTPSANHHLTNFLYHHALYVIFGHISYLFAWLQHFCSSALPPSYLSTLVKSPHASGHPNFKSKSNKFSLKHLKKKRRKWTWLIENYDTIHMFAAGKMSP